MPTFLTVKEAAKATGRSTSSIRRAIYPITKNDHHPDRAHVEPDIQEVMKLRVAGVNFAWRVSEEFLARALPVTAPAEKGSGSQAKAAAESQGDLLAMLQRELEIKNQQINAQAEQLRSQLELMNALSERLREGNILIGSAQQRQGLGEGSEIGTAVTPEAPRAPEPKAAKTVSAKRPPASALEKPTKAAAAKPRRGILDLLFGRK